MRSMTSGSPADSGRSAEAVLIGAVIGALAGGTAYWSFGGGGLALAGSLLWGLVWFVAIVILISRLGSPVVDVDALRGKDDR